MTEITASLMEVLLFGGLLLLAVLLSRPFHVNPREAGRAKVRRISWLHGIAAFLSLPFFALVPALILFYLSPLYTKHELYGLWIEEQVPRLNAWLMFWSLTFLIRLLEALPVCSFWARGKRFPIPNLLRSMLRSIVTILIALAVLKNMLNYNVTGLVASTALVTAVIGFALQGVLSNLLSGISLHFVRSVVPSDWIKIDDIEGEVIETNWRETRLRTTGGHVMIVPNSTIANATVHNMSWPSPLRRHAIHVGASYSDSPDQVTRELVLAAKSVEEVLKDQPIE